MRAKTVVLFLFLVHVVSAQEDFRINYLAAQMDQYCDMRSGESTGTSLSQQQPSGERIGKAGPRGPPGSVNYTMVNEMIKRTVSDLVTNLSDELSQNARECRVELETVNEKVRKLNETLQQLLTPTDLPTTTPASTTTTQNVDECTSAADNNCHASATCANNVGSYTCVCNSGYFGNGVTCDDVDECASTANNNCHASATCANTVGSYVCACNSGYSGNGVTCKKESCSSSSLAFDGKCFTVFMEQLTKTQAIEKCRTAVNGQPANLYSKSHYEAVINYIPPSNSEILLGMTYNPTNNVARMSDGSLAPYVTWLKGWPNSAADSTVLALRVNADNSDFKGMWNYAPGYAYQGALCES